MKLALHESETRMVRWTCSIVHSASTQLLCSTAIGLHNHLPHQERTDHLIALLMDRSQL